MPRHDLNLHLARKEDFSVVSELVQEYFAFDGLDFNERVGGAIRELLNDPTLGAYYLALVGDEVVGYCGLTYGFDAEVGGRLGLVTDLYLRPEARGKGLGRQMVDQLVLIAVAAGLRSIELAVIEGNQRAERLYSSAGFVRGQGRFWMSRRV